MGRREESGGGSGKERGVRRREEWGEESFLRYKITKLIRLRKLNLCS